MIKFKLMIRRLGLDIRYSKNVIPLDLTSNQDLSPIAAAYEGRGRDVLIQVPLKYCRHMSWNSYPCHLQSESPFIKTLLQYQRKECRIYEGSFLEKYYKHYQPRTASELLGLKKPSYELFSSLPPSAAPVLWASQNPRELVDIRKRAIDNDNREHGSRLTYNDGDTFFGPVSVKKGQLEYKRLISVYESIKKNGFRLDSTGLNNIHMVCLINSNYPGKYSFEVSSGGQHRLAALTVLGYEKIVVQLAGNIGTAGIIRSSEVECWPSVVNGYYTVQEALAIYDRFFNGTSA